MKKIFLLTIMCLVSTIAHAEILNLQTSGVTKVLNNDKKTECTGNYSFSIDTERNLLFINCQNKGNQNCFTLTGTYTVKHVETVRDNYAGTAYALLVSQNGIDYVLTITNKMISFSKNGQTASLCWHFHVVP